MYIDASLSKDKYKELKEMIAQIIKNRMNQVMGGSLEDSVNFQIAVDILNLIGIKEEISTD